MGIVAETIRTKLEAAFQPSALHVLDESHLHAGTGLAYWQTDFAIGVGITLLPAT